VSRMTECGTCRIKQKLRKAEADALVAQANAQGPYPASHA
jgi:hypothetical protein